MRRSSRQATIDTNPDPQDKLLASNTAANSTTANITDPSTASSSSTSSSKGKKRAQQDDTDISIAPAPDHDSSASSNPARRKRKSVTFEEFEPLPAAPSPRATRSRRSSTASASSASEAQPPSAKSLGKRRALSPASEHTPSVVAAPAPTSQPSKRRKTSQSTSTVSPAADPTEEKDYNLRSRQPTTPADSTQPTSTSSSTKKKTRSKPSSSKPSPNSAAAAMPRKGSRASRAAKAKARAYEEDGEGDRPLGLPESDVEMADVAEGSSSVDVKKRETLGVPPVAPFPTGGDDEDDEDDDEDDDEESGSESDSDEEQVIGGDGGGDIHFDDDDDEEEYETSLRADGSAHGDHDHDGYHSGGGDSDLIDPPQTFDADGSPLGTNSELMDQAALDASDAAEAAALFGSGGAFRALQGMMSGMSGRLKGLLASLRQKGGDGGAKLLALQDLAELLSVSTEDTLSGYFQVEAFVKELVSILRGDSNGGGGGGGEGGSGLTEEEMIAFGMDPAEHGGGGGGSEENDVQMMLLACRCLANLMEALPGTAHSVVYAGAVPVLCSKLLEIQYIDLAEQTLSTLEKISEEVPSSIVREGGLGALLTFLDFFSFHVQRTAVTAAANCCRSLSLDSFKMVQDVIPIFKNILGYPDQRVVEQGCLAVVRIVDSYRHYPEKLEALLTPDLLAAVRALLNPDSTTVGPNTYTQTLKMLSTASKASPGVAINLVELNMANTLYHLLTGVAAPDFPTDEGPQVTPKSEREGDDMLVMQNLVQRPKEQIQETLNLICELLPPLPKDGIFDSRAFSGRPSKSSAAKEKVKREDVSPDVGGLLGTSGSVATSASVSKDDLNADVKMEAADDAPALPTPAASGSRSASRAGKPRDAAKEAILEKRLQLLKEGPKSRKVTVNRFYALMLPILVDVCAASVNSQVRSKAVLGLLKIVNFCDKEPLAEILHTVSMASFLAAILSSRDQGPLVTNALQLVELLLVKMPDAYQYFFRREGVMHEIEQIASAALALQPKSKKSSPARTPKSTNDSSATGTGANGLARALQQLPLGGDAPLLSPAEAQAQDMITLRARHLRDDYGAADSEPALRARAALDNIEELVAELHKFAEPKSKGHKLEKEVTEVLERVAKLFSDEKEPLSSFELLESGLVDGLLKFATESGTPTLSTQRRQELLATAFMPRVDSGKSTPAFGLLVKRLQESLSRMEEFEVQLAAQNSSDIDSRRNGSSMLARQLKLRLVAEEGSDIPRSCTNIVVSIHAIATFQAFNDYLRPRIIAATTLSDRLGSGNSSAPGGAGTLSSFLAAFAAANGSPPPESSSSSGANAAGESRLASSLGAVIAAAEAAQANAEASGSSGKKSPTRRRSRRLSGKGAAGEEVEASSSKVTVDAEPAPPVPATEEQSGEDDHFDHDAQEEDDELFAGDFGDSPDSRDERPVNLEVADDNKVVAKTPDGTRVATPTLAGSSARPPPAPKPRASYAAAVKAEPSDFHLEFSMGDRDVNLDTTVYGAVHNHELRQPGANRRNMWHSVYEVKFRKVAGPARPDEDHAASPEPTSRDETTILTKMPESIPADSSQAKILQLLWVLHRLNLEYGDTGEVGSTGLADASFVNNKLTAKLNRQLEEPMIVASACLPDWATDLPVHFPFLFPFDSRFTFLQSTAFGYARLMQKWVGQSRADNSRRDDNLGFLGRLQRQKVRISRDRMLESAFKVFELYGSNRASLEVEFFSEVGSGLGPTLEFYALVSKEFARKELAVWRHGDATTTDFVHNAAGLFPSPMDESTSEAAKKKLKIFRILGQFVAKSMMDSRIIDVHFSRAFMRLVLDQELPLTVAAVKTVDKDLGYSLAHLQDLVDAKQALEADESKTEGERESELAKITSTISDLTLDFTLPGYDIDLTEGGQDVAVELANLEEYIRLVIDWTLRKGVMLQLKEFKTGFSSVFPVRDLQSFTPAELVMLTGALDEDWTIEGLTNAVKADHGFTMDSRPVKDLLSIMSQFSLDERREFLAFTTGSPRLPIGGFSALSPTLTIVRKDGGDGALFSSMTCVSYIKLPNYSSRDVVKERVLFAIREGQGGFHLS